MEAGSIVARIGARIDELRSGVAQARGELDSLRATADANNRRLEQTGKTLIRNVTLPIVGIGVAAVKTAADFEAGMNKVRAISGATGSDFDNMKEKALEMGRTTRYSATEAAGALTYLAMAGFNATEATEALPGVLDLAAASGMDLATTADYASNILTGFGLEVKDLSRLNDVLAATFTSSNVNMSQLAESMKYVGPVAAGLGITIEETAAALGILGNAGIQGSMAGTTLRQSLLQLMTPGGRAQAVIERLGLEVLDAEGNFIGLESIIRQLNESGASTVDMMELFGARAAGMISLVAAGGDEFKEFVDDLENAGGTAQRVAEIQLEGLTGAWIKMRSALEGALISIGNQLLPMITRLVDRFTEWFQAVAELPPETIKLIVMIGGLVAAIGPLVFIIAKVKMAMMSWKIATMVLKSGLLGVQAASTATAAAAAAGSAGMLGMKGGMEAVGAAAVAKTGALGTMGAKLAGLAAAAGPIALVAIALAGLGFLVHQTYKNWVKDAVDSEAIIAQHLQNVYAGYLASGERIQAADLEHKRAMLQQELEHLAEKENLSREEKETAERLGNELIAVEGQIERQRQSEKILIRRETANLIAAVDEENAGESIARINELAQEEIAAIREVELEKQLLAAENAFIRGEIEKHEYKERIARIQSHWETELLPLEKEKMAEWAAIHAEGMAEIGYIWDTETMQWIDIADANMGEALQGAADLMKESGPVFQQEGKELVYRFGEGLVEASPEAAKSGKAVGDAAAEGVKGSEGEFSSAGQAAGSSFASGLLSQIGKVVNAAKELARRAGQTLRNWLEARSPSKLFERLGETVPEGYALGIAGGARKVMDSVRDMYRATLPLVGGSGQPAFAVSGGGLTGPAGPAAGPGGQNIEINAHYYGIDQETARAANDDLVRKLQLKGVGGSVR